MATLTETEKRQLRRRPQTTVPTPRSERRPIAEYLAFARFAARIAPERTGDKAALIKQGSHWKL